MRKKLRQSFSCEWMISGRTIHQFSTKRVGCDRDLIFSSRCALPMVLRSGLDPDKVPLVINHVAVANSEMKALIEMNNAGQHNEEIPLVANHREAELKTLLSGEFQQLIKKGKVQLVNYSDL